MLRLYPEEIYGRIVNILAMSRINSVDQIKERSDSNIDVHFSPDVPQALIVVVVENIYTWSNRRHMMV